MAPSSERSRGTTSGAPWLKGGQAGDPKQAAWPSCPCWSPPLPPCSGHHHKLHRSFTSSGLRGDVCSAHPQGTEVGGWLGHPHCRRSRSPDPRLPVAEGQGQCVRCSHPAPTSGLSDDPPHTLAEKADFANLFFKSREVTKIEEKGRGLGEEGVAQKSDIRPILGGRHCLSPWPPPGSPTTLGEARVPEG